jgi:hypothetical protein
MLLWPFVFQQEMDSCDAQQIDITPARPSPYQLYRRLLSIHAHGVNSTVHNTSLEAR